MKIAAFGDIHMDTASLNSIPLEDFDIAIITGDLTNFGGVKDANAVLDVIQERVKDLLAVPGNLDKKELISLFDEKGIGIHGKGRVINDAIGIFGCGGSNSTPFNTPFELSDNEIRDILSKGYKMVENALIKIMVCHTPPKGSGLDVISAGVAVGSPAVTDFIEEFQPDLCLTGHIHEAKGEAMIGKTKVINPGMTKDGGWIEIVIDEAARDISTVLH